MTNQPCEPCRYAIDGECRRYPPVAVYNPGDEDMRPHIASMFPAAYARCGEFKATDKALNEARRLGESRSQPFHISNDDIFGGN